MPVFRPLLMLKEFQQKSSPASVGGERGGGGGGGGGSGTGSKKKRKVKELSQLDAPSGDRDSPDNTFADLETVGSPVSQLLEEPNSESGRGSPVSNSASAATNSEFVSHNTELQEFPDTNGNCSLKEENRPLSSTESLRQISQQLNGLVSESTSACYVNGETVPSGELESRNQELAAALESSKLTNSQLSTKLDQLVGLHSFYKVEL
ncbi:hypothetical protein AMECASPLE_031241 [Ameca splendens]|uniref:Uncharacterized protein n=1 Tax=Ameca splendens TaxID=208324 RepID=A0ABV1A1P1_9TELE